MIYQASKQSWNITVQRLDKTTVKLILDVRSTETRTNQVQQTLTRISLCASLAESKETVYN